MHNRKELYTLVTISNVDMGSLHTKQNSKLCPMNSWQSFIFYCCLNSWNHCSTLFTFAIFNVVRHILNSKTVCLAIYKVDVKWVMNKSTYGLILYLFFAYLYFWINNRVRVKVKINKTHDCAWMCHIANTCGHIIIVHYAYYFFFWKTVTYFFVKLQFKKLIGQL